ncbi:HTH_Tnp_Tc3_2 domain-containing protein [Trichonephila clavipes]|nr:HTH_Tnp_Tc3_2 domain-containing protein [Trichonephila clavipes]
MTLMKDLKEHPVFQDSPKDLRSDSSLEIELTLPFAPNCNSQESPQQPEFRESCFTIHQNEIFTNSNNIWVDQGVKDLIPIFPTSQSSSMKHMQVSVITQRLDTVVTKTFLPDATKWSAMSSGTVVILFLRSERGRKWSTAGVVADEAWRVVGRLEGGQTQAQVAQAIGVSQSVISRIWNRFFETRSADRRPGQRRRRTTTPNEDRYLVLTARRHRNMNATLLQQHFRSATGTTVSTQTVRNRLHGVGLYAR